MEIREFAEIILFGDTIAEKYFAPEGGVRALTDGSPGEPRSWQEPGRPPELRIAPRSQRKRLPSPNALHDPDLRVRVLHTFANHELMALELMAWALVAYPDAPPAFRRGLAHIIVDEQRHLRLYAERISALGAELGSQPVNDHFWRCAHELTDPLKWVCAMNLTFEQANLDHAPVYAHHFDAVGDRESAELMKVIASDEEMHVAFGARFLRANTPRGRSTFDVWVDNLTFHNTPERARGDDFQVKARIRAGLDEDYVARLRDLGSERDSKSF